MDTLEFGGKAYISAVRAAKQNGYTADYMGQLIRAGKLKGQKVGRAWYVEMDSLAAYLGSTPAVPTQEEREDSQVAVEVEAPQEKEETISAPEVHPVKMTVSNTVASAEKEISDIRGEQRFAEKYQMLTYMPAEQEPELPTVEKRNSQLTQETHQVPIRTAPQEQHSISHAEVRIPHSVAQRSAYPMQQAAKEVTFSDDHYFEPEEKKGVAGAFLGSALAWCLVFGVFGFGIMSIFAAKEVKYTTGQEAAAAVALSLETLGTVKDYILGSN